jgi:RHH-type proline utilization regulon transcriptional repressor/proline dehydrogenase/delta 1-pyrroline-5-carboxylate dehydrogenase
VFTGSSEAAGSIQRSLASRCDPRVGTVPLIAETGGQNAMIVDSSALPEQAVADIIASGFDSAGQRCSALRILLVQEEIAGRLLDMLRGAMRELRVGRPDRLDTDVGPVISAGARDTIQRHVQSMRDRGFAVFTAELTPECSEGTFVAPTLIEIPEPAVLGREVFGPVVHAVRYHREALDAMIDQVNALGYGLTFGIHSRIDETIEHATRRIRAGNLYVNRNIIGAVVGSQPFGGHGLSGTGPKAGGPLYLRRLLQEHPMSGSLIGTRPEVFAAFLSFLHAEGLDRDIAAVGDTTPYGVSIELPGPVGEQNTYSLEPRGSVLCVAATEQGAVRQIAASLATGNRALVRCAQPLPWIDRLPTELGRHIARAAAEAIGDAGAVLFEGDDTALCPMAMQIAERGGPLTALYTAAAKPPWYPLEFLMTERTISVNTAAAGGNASLMTIG